MYSEFSHWYGYMAPANSVRNTLNEQYEQIQITANRLLLHRNMNNNQEIIFKTAMRETDYI